MKTKFKDTEIGLIPEDWGIKQVKEVAKINELTIKNYFPHKEIEYIDIRSVDKGKIIEIKKIPLDKAPSRAKRIVRDKDILISTVRPNLKHFAFIKSAKQNTIASTGFAVITSKEIAPQFLYSYLTTGRYTNYLSAIADTHTSTYPSFNPDVIENSFVPFPKKEEQTSIAKILSGLDSKIELLQKQNKTLEAIAKALFKHWFVDFEFPNKEGKPYKSSGGEMVDSELGEIPKGWRVGKIGEILKIQIGGDWGKDTEFESAVQVNSLRGVDLEKIKLNGYSEEAPLRWVKKNSLEKRKLTDCDILIGGSGLGPIGRTIYFSKELEGLYEHPITYSNFCKRLSVQTHSYAVYAEKVLEDMYISGEMKQYFTGTSIPNLDANSLLNHNIIIPSKDVVNDFFKIAISEFSKLYNKENMILSQIRNSLLPKLMSGKIRVPVEVE